MFDYLNPFSTKDPTVDDLIDLQERVNLGNASKEQRELFGKFMRKRLEQLERMAGNAVYDPKVSDSYFRALCSCIREIRYWEQSLLVNETKGSKLAEFLDKLLKKKNKPKEVNT